MANENEILTQISIWGTIGVGVATGIAASFIFKLLGIFWGKIIEPYFINSLYRDVDITDRWKVTFPAKKMLRVKSNGDFNDEGDTDKSEVKRLEGPAQENLEREAQEKETGFRIITISVANEYIATLERKGEQVSGTLVGTKGGDEGRIYTIKGSFRNLILSACIDSNDKKTLERGTMSLMLKKNGDELLGSYSMYEDSLHTIVSMKTVFERIKN